MPTSKSQTHATDLAAIPDLKDRLRAFARNFSIEVTPRDAADIPSFSDLLPPQTAVHITHLLGAPLSELLPAISRLAAEGMQPVPHIAARNLESVAELEDFLEQTCDETGLRQVMLIGGGASSPKGPYTEALQILETGLFERFGVSTIGIAGHPEGSPDIDDQELKNAMRKKADHARQNRRPHVCRDPVLL